MAVSLPLLLLSSFLLVPLVLVVLRQPLWVRRRGLPLPPGPPAHALFGHLRVVPTLNPEWKFAEWSKKYQSDVLYFDMLVQKMVILNSAQAAMDLLDKRGANFSDRPRFVLFEVMGWRRTMAFMPWGPLFRLHRKILQSNLQKSSIVQYQAMQERETRTLLMGVSKQPENWEILLRRFATAVVLSIGFGVELTSDKGDYMQMAEDASYALGHGGPPAGTLVDFFPLVRHLPDWLVRNNSLKFARKWNPAVRRLHDLPYNNLLSSGKRALCLIQTLLDQREAECKDGTDTGLTVDDIKGVAVAVFAAGQDTTWASLMVFIFNMVMNPEIQEKARGLLDEVIGHERLPTFKDKSRVPYMDYIIQETLRWCPVSPLGLPHRSMEDDTYNGMFIPRGTLIYANARAMTHDKHVYQNPDKFEPERYIPKEDGGRGEPYPKGQFGFGRRICVGQHLAEASMWIVAVSLLATYDIKKALDPDGKEIVPELKLSNGLTSHPEGFPCRLVPRADRARFFGDLSRNEM
ncbi:hypothetical protein PFICI_01681 [Pestalotiopsis fici W106-1]|uniref:Cytochrome P450 n=1 Tax=Pestalotiopsis fici (strain W106-1 / CGMCC3.15140) TaxID=1229662 RepID=W3XP67_PESFW|nr:uncharacterized protein PFICI_01681 [Pestalotiopsis fici W106-1]ETS87853.1 hypothetical protein PFICI_01681 [Pestalotiopsis fici W106-1]